MAVVFESAIDLAAVVQSETSHGMVILVHKDIPSDLAQQFVFGPHAESLTIRIWTCGSSYLIHNIYNNGATVNLSAAPLNERSMFLGDFNAHHRTWCRGVVVVVCLFIRFLSVDQSSRSGSR